MKRSPMRRLGRSSRKAASDRSMAAVRPALRERAGGACEYCQEALQGGGHAHHRLRRGGPDRDVLSNLIRLCPACHQWAHSAPAAARRDGLILGAGQTPAAVPVLYRGQWAYIDDEGGVTPCP